MAFVWGIAVGTIAALPLMIALRGAGRMATGIVAVLLSFLLFHAGIVLVWRLSPANLAAVAITAVAVFLATLGALAKTRG